MTLVIVGTGTDVGKTVVAATLLARYGAEIPLAYWKPVATGSREGRDTATVEALAGDRAVILAESYLFTEPLSPHLAARLDGRRIEPAVLLADFDRHRAAGRTLVIETAGGLLVPLTGGGDGGAPESARGSGGGWPFRLPPAVGSASPPGYLQADLLVDMARRAALACLVVGRSGLGTMNHTLLTLEALRSRGLPLAGVVLDGPPNRENRLAIQRLGAVEAILELPHLAPLDREEVAAATRHFDRQGHLAPLLRLRRHLPGPGDRPGEGKGSRRGSRLGSRRGSQA
ncbi:MAG: dethiobiotin synthase [Acidobacteria bacterium]|nr:dethiobiotin synthase [Acidobacteriota bacterium]